MMEFNAAVILAVPALTPVAIPVCNPMVATVVFVEAHVADVVMSAFVPSAYVPSAANRWVANTLMLAFKGVTAIETNGLATVNVAGLLMIESMVAVMSDAPTPVPVARPVCALIVAAEAFEDAQVTDVVKSSVLAL